MATPEAKLKNNIQPLAGIYARNLPLWWEAVLTFLGLGTEPWGTQCRLWWAEVGLKGSWWRDLEA